MTGIGGRFCRGRGRLLRLERRWRDWRGWWARRRLRFLLVVARFGAVRRPRRRRGRRRRWRSRGGGGISLNLNVDLSATAQTMEGFGGCFNELGWTSLSKLSDGDRESVLRELFDPVAGARFSLCRMPIGANDFALKAYSYDETKDDFELKHFSIENDRATLIPFIQAAQRYQPKLRVWASPWSPPSWMKKNGFYAEAAGRAGQKDNGIRPDQIGHEGENMFILQ